MGSASDPRTASHQRLFDDALEHSSIGFDVVDAAGRFIYANPAYLRLWGYDSLAELVGKPAAEHCADPEVPAAIIAEVLAHGACVREFLARRRDGSTFDVEMSIRRSVDPQGAAVFYGTSIDVTERKRGERALRESQRHLRAFITQAPIAIAMFDREMRYLAVSGGWARSFGRGHPDLIGMCHYEIHPDMPRWWREVHQRGLAGEVISADEDMWRHPDGFDQWLRWSVRPWRDDAGDIGGIIIFAEDISTRMSAERALRDSEEKFARAFRISPDAININRLKDGVYLEVNEGYSRLTGYTAEEVLGRRSLDINIWVDPQDRDKLAELLRRDGEVLNFEAPFRLKNGSVRTGLMSARLIEIGGEACILSITRDVSDRKRAEAALRESEAQLHQSQKMEAIGQLAGGVAHDYNNMIGVVLGYATLVEDSLAPEDPNRAHIATIIGAARRSADLTRQLLGFARRQVATPVPLDLNAEVRSVHGMLERLIGEDIALRLVLADDLWTVKLDATQAHQIFANLATNARDAIAGVGEIVITTDNVAIEERDCRDKHEWRPGEFVRIDVRDSGCGMDEATLARAFEPFFTTKPQGMGTGLGLATAFGIVKQNDGFIDVASAPGAGTTFTIHLPRHRGEAAPRPVGALGERPRGTETILVVEDEPQLLQFVSAALSHQGYNVLAAGSPGEAIHIAVESPTPIDLLLTDVIMPGMNGNELRERLVELCPGLAVVFMSGHPAEVIAKRGVVAPDVDLLNKPFTIDELCQRLRAALDT